MQPADIATDPALLAETKRLLPSLQARASWPAGTEGVKQIVGRRFAIYPQPERSDGEWSAWWADYFDALKDLPAPALAQAMADWVKTDAEFMPKPGQLRQLALNTRYREAIAYDRARRATEYRPPYTGPRYVIEAPTARGIPEPTAAEKAAVRRMLANYLRDQTAREGTPLAERPPTHGATDETGITPQMRALMERQRERT